MAIARVHTAQPDVLRGTHVTIEVDISRGLHAFSVVGLPGKAIEEAKDRVSSAIKNTGFPSPKSSNHKIVVSLAPADVKKDGPLYDVPIAIAYLIATEVLSADVSHVGFVGELALDGTLRPVTGILSAVTTLAAAGVREVIVPAENAAEAALVSGVTIFPAHTLYEILAHLDTRADVTAPLRAQPRTVLTDHWQEGSVALEDIRGQETAKRALIIAAAGGHNVLLVGPPGTGKTMLARAFQGLLPPLGEAAALEVLRIHSVAGVLTTVGSVAPPFRAPHHTASHTSLVGGGTHPRPGEVTLAHHGVLFLDEFPEFERRCLDALRQPLEDRVVTISRVQGTAVFPADFILIAAMNPYRGAEDGTTNYAAAMNETYRQKVSGPILDRIDLWVEVPHVTYDTLTATRERSNETDRARDAILHARTRMRERLATCGKDRNGRMSARDLEDTVTLDAEVRSLLRDASARLNLSPRSYHRVVKVARTIADLAASEHIAPPHVLEALQYRVKY